MFLIEDLQKLRDLDRNNLTNIQDRCYKEVRNVGMYIYIHKYSTMHKMPATYKNIEGFGSKQSYEHSRHATKK